MSQVRRAPLPQPVTFTLTVKEAAALHNMIVAIFNVLPDWREKQPEVVRACTALEAVLTKAGCRRDKYGDWYA